LDKRIDALSRHTDALAVSFDVNNKQVFNRTRGVDGFEKVKKNIQLAQRLGVEIDLISVITKDTYEQLDYTIEFAKSLELPIHFSAVDNVPRETGNEIDLKDMKATGTNQVLERLKKEKKKYKKIHFESEYFKFQESGGFNNFIRCSSASTTISLKPDGSVTLPCPFFTLMKIEKDEKLENGLKREKARKIIKECGRWDFCKNCSVNCMYVVSLIKNPYFLIRWVKDKL
jgi:MoaA/NifB/PqqE/SkfB family radical SAM enzyme